ncbi:MAG: DNA polymerase IV [Bacteroidota bacterium]
MHRKIIHIDMDAFYASVEQRDDPELRGKPVVVGWGSKRGVVAAASYEARKFGVRSALPSITAKRLCPDLIFVRPRFDVYKKISNQIREIFFEYTDLVEPLSLDEAYLDVTHNKKGLESATKIAREIRARILETTNLTASAGISINKFLAKVASDINKPDGITLIPPDRAEPFLEKLPIEKFFGIGKKTAEKMKKMGLRTGADLKAWSELDLARKFGKMGRHYYKIVRARDERLVKPDRLRKSVGIENTFSDDLETAEEMLAELQKLTEKLCGRLHRISTKARTITLKIKYHDFELKTRSKSQNSYLDQEEDIFPIVEHLLFHPEFPVKAVRLLGVYASNLDNLLDDTPRQLTLEF